MIPHFLALDVDVKICQEQLYSSIRDDHATFLVKNTVFKEEVAWQPQKELEKCSPGLLEPLSRAFIWGIVCLSTIIGCGERQTIPHINALLSGTKILEEQTSSFFRGCQATSSLKSVLFTRKVAWSSLIELHSCSWHILNQNQGLSNEVSFVCLA